MLKLMLTFLFCMPLVCSALDDTEKIVVACELALDHTSCANKRSTTDALRLVCSTWRNRIDHNKNALLKNLPQLAMYGALAPSLVFNRYNEWCGLGKYEGQHLIIFGNAQRWCVTRIEAKHNIAAQHEGVKREIMSTSFNGRSAFFMPDCYIIPQDQALHTFCMEPAMRLCKKIYPLLFTINRRSTGCFDQTPLWIQHAPQINPNDMRFENYFLLKPLLTNTYNGTQCSCQNGTPSELCKETYEAIVAAAEEEELDEATKQKVSAHYLQHHLFYQCTGEPFEALERSVTINSHNRLDFKGAYNSHDWFQLPSTTTTSNTNLSWDSAQAAVHKQGEQWQCKNSFVYQCNASGTSTIASIINVRTGTTIAHQLTIPHPNITVRDIFFKDICVYIYLHNESTKQAYMVTWPHEFIKKRETNCYKDNTHAQWHTLTPCTIEQADIQPITDATELVNRLLDTVNEDTMHIYALPSPEPMIDWQSIGFVSCIKHRNYRQNKPYLKPAELEQLKKLPKLYAKHLENQEVVLSQCPKSWSWYASSILLAPYWDYSLMDKCYQSGWYNNGDWPFFSGFVYGVGTICACWPWNLPSTIRTTGINGIMRYITSGAARHIITDTRELNIQAPAWCHALDQLFKASAYSFPLLMGAAAFADAYFYGGPAHVTFLSYLLWGVFDGFCMTSSNAVNHINCAYSEIWLSRWAKLRQWHQKKS